MEPFVYRKEKTNQISFPLGGIGTGCIGLAGNGRLIDWEIFNRPNKGSVNGFSHFAIRAEQAGSVTEARILHGPLLPPYQGELHAPRFSTSGWGPRREFLTGLPHFAEVDFRGEFPLATLLFQDDTFPGQVQLTAFNPFIPTNTADSSLPVAFLELRVTNTTAQPHSYTLVGVLTNPLPSPHRNRVETHPWGTALHLAGDGLSPEDVAFGDMTLATDAEWADDVAVSWQQYWFRGHWFDNLEVYWHDLNAPGPFLNRVYDSPAQDSAAQDTGLLAVHVPVAPGESRSIRFALSWSFPRCEHYWHQGPEKATWRNHYALCWANSAATAQYALTQWDRLYAETVRFKEALFTSTLPHAVLDAVSANISILKSPTVLRLEDGTLYGWEGLHPEEGCCEGSCTHVWNYQQALPFLFPELERSMRTADYRYNLRADGSMPFRIQLPLGTAPWSFRPCCDGQLGGVMKTYRDWKICGDDEWLRSLWPAVKQSLEYAWSPDNLDRWDPECSGVLTGRQHHTLDMELFGPNAWLTGFYLGALKAAAEMAAHLGEPENAATYRAIFERGKAWVDAHLFNGEYYIQHIDLADRSLVEAYGDQDDTLRGGTAAETYWNREHNEIKYQIGAGSSIDQVLAQWHASLYGLGDLLDPQQVTQACAAIYRHNFIPDMSKVCNPCRIYSLNDEGGLIICAWPEGVRKPLIPAPYSQETMNGFEYAAASHMIMVGLVEEGVRCVAAIRHRYDGARRNPWNEFECGNNYARSMASYALLHAFSGFQFDMVTCSVGFQPVQSPRENFRCFWALHTGWGQFQMDAAGCQLQVLYGVLPLQQLRLPDLTAVAIKGVALDGAPLAFTRKGGDLNLDTRREIKAGQTLQVTRG